MFDELDKILQTRKTPEVPEGLSARIVGAATRHTQLMKDVYGLEAFWADVQSMFRMPVPVFACCVFLVLLAGAFMGASSDFLTLASDDFASFMLIEDRFVVGEWV